VCLEGVPKAFVEFRVGWGEMGEELERRGEEGSVGGWGRGERVRGGMGESEGGEVGRGEKAADRWGGEEGDRSGGEGGRDWGWVKARGGSWVLVRGSGSGRVRKLWMVGGRWKSAVVGGLVGGGDV